MSGHIVVSPKPRTWQTLTVIAVLTLLGRFFAGSGFGYTLLAVVWVPVAAMVGLADEGRPARGVWVGGAVGLVASWPWWTTEPWVAAGRMTAVQIAVSASLPACGLLLRHCKLAPAMVPITAGLGWLAWVGVPLCRPDLFGERWAGLLLRANPVLMMNAASATAGDWTHQAVAYHWLTRLGQDVPFEWPSAITATTLLYATPCLMITFLPSKGVSL